MKINMHAFALASKCGSRGAKGFTNASDAVADFIIPSSVSMDPSAAMPRPLAVVLRNCRRWCNGLLFVIAAGSWGGLGMDYMFQTPTTRVWNDMYRAGDLNAAQAKFWQDKPVEELFDLQTDPDEINNLATSPDYQKKTTELRNTLQKWMQETLDLGLLPEAEMHRLAGSQSPREYAVTHKKLFARLSELAFRSMDQSNGYSTEELVNLSSDPHSGIRFWAVRGLAVRPATDTKRNKTLITASSDESPSVAIAACDGLLANESRSTQRKAIERLIELADVNRHGHFAAVAALNALDMNADLSASERKRLASLSRQAKKPPIRLGKYVGKLIDHATSSQ